MPSWKQAVVPAVLLLAVCVLPCPEWGSAQTRGGTKPASRQAASSKLNVPPTAKPATALAVKTATITVEVPRRIEFLRDIAPILDRGSCSTAECHGKFGGRGGLQLSLLTLSPEDDYDPLIHGSRGRRVDFSDPKNSLLLLKATGAVKHAGGPRFSVGSPYYKTILQWLEQGAPFEETDPRLTKLEITPSETMFKKSGQRQQLKAIATYTDGSVRDVTAQTVFMSSNDAVLGVSPTGDVTANRWGGGAILGRYLGTIAASFFTLPQERKGPYPTVATTNPIDKLVLDNLKRLNIVPSSVCGDTEFLRRVTLDTAGRLPTPEEIHAFVADKAADKRAKLIDRLVDSPEFADFRALRLADLLRVHPRKLGDLGDRSAALFYEWIWKAVSRNQPWDEFVRDVINARGSTYQYGPANFYRIETTANDRMENIGQAFLGVRMSCARCHKHPFDRWTTDDYWNFASFTGRVALGGGRLYNENVVYYSHGSQTVNQSVNGRNKGKVAPATYLGDKAPAKEQPDMQTALAAWVTDPQNRFFARATVNRLWSYYFGKGIIHPVDDMRPTIPESVPGLIDLLAGELVKSKYDVKQMVRLILNSRTYQTSALPNDSNLTDDRYFSRFLPKPMPAEALLDMLNQATGVGEQFSSFPERARAIQVAYPVGNYFLDAFGQSHREFLADIDPKLEPNLVQTLHMINSPYVNDKVRNGSVVDSVLKESKTEEEIVKNLYTRTVCRPPGQKELEKSVAMIKEAGDKKEGTQDLLWALITSREFYFNH
jgi:hypothetical protein